MTTRSHGERLDALRELASSVALELGLELVELTLRGSSRRRILRVDIDRAGPGGVTVDDCKRMSDALGARLDGDDSLLPDSYVLEASSPGIDRPIRTADDVRRNTGRRVVVVAGNDPAGRREFRGVLLGQIGDEVRLRNDDETEVRIPLGDVVRAQQDVGL